MSVYVLFLRPELQWLSYLFSESITPLRY